MNTEPEQIPLLERLLTKGISREALNEGLSLKRSKYICEVILNSAYILGNSKEPWEYKTFETLASEEFVSYFHWVESALDTGFVMEFFESALSNYCELLNCRAYYVGRGLVVHVKSKTGGFREATDQDDIYRHLRRIVREGLLSEQNYFKAPDWATQLYVKRRDLEIYHAITLDSCDSEMDSVKASAMQALRRQENSSSGSSEKITPKAENAYLRLIAYLALRAEETDSLPLKKPHKAAGIITTDAESRGIVGIGKPESVAQKLKKALDLINKEKTGEKSK